MRENRPASAATIADSITAVAAAAAAAALPQMLMPPQPASLSFVPRGLRRHLAETPVSGPTVGASRQLGREWLN